jgi:hypothetical protein
MERKENIMVAAPRKPENVFHQYVKTISVIVSMLLLVVGGAVAWKGTVDAVQRNCEEIRRVDTEGCAPATRIQKEIAVMKIEANHVAEDVHDIKAQTSRNGAKISEIKELLIRMERNDDG